MQRVHHVNMHPCLAHVACVDSQQGNLSYDKKPTAVCTLVCPPPLPRAYGPLRDSAGFFEGFADMFGMVGRGDPFCAVVATKEG